MVLSCRLPALSEAERSVNFPSITTPKRRGFFISITGPRSMGCVKTISIVTAAPGSATSAEG